MARGVNTPLKIMNEMPIEFKYIPIIKLEWQLNETMEEAHKYVYVTMSKITTFSDRNIPQPETFMAKVWTKSL